MKAIPTFEAGGQEEYRDFLRSKMEVAPEIGFAAEHTGGRALIVLPLGVRQEFRRDAAELLGLEPPPYVRTAIDQYTNPGELVLDPFGGLGTTALEAVKRGRRGCIVELNPDYFREAVTYLQAEEEEEDAPTLFDFLGIAQKYGSRTGILASDSLLPEGLDD